MAHKGLHRNLLLNICKRVIILAVTVTEYPPSYIMGVTNGTPPNPQLFYRKSGLIRVNNSGTMIDTNPGGNDTNLPRLKLLLSGVQQHCNGWPGSWSQGGLRISFGQVVKFWSNYSDLTRPGPPNGGLVREIPLFQGNLGW